MYINLVCVGSCSYSTSMSYRVIARGYNWRQTQQLKVMVHYFPLILLTPRRRRLNKRLGQTRPTACLRTHNMERKIQLANQFLYSAAFRVSTIPVIQPLPTQSTYFNNFSISIVIHLVLICSTAKAAYPGSVICLRERMSRSTASSLFTSLKACGAMR